MTPADRARDNAIAFECKKNSLRQNQSGDWQISFTVQGVDMDDRITRAAMGTRFQAVLVEIGDDELPVHQPAKESKPSAAQPQPKDKPAGAKRNWRDVPPTEQAGIHCNDPVFWAFLRESRGWSIDCELDAAICVRNICDIESRSELNKNHKARVIWHQLDEQFWAWKALEHA